MQQNYPQYSYEQGKEMFSKALYTTQAQDVHAERCRDDVMYALLTSTRPQEGKDGGIVLEFLQECCALIVTKNSPDLEQSRMFRDARRFVLDESADQPIRVFFLLFILNKEPEVQELIRKSLMRSENKPGNLWGKAAVAHFDDFLESHLSKMVEATLNWPCSPMNMVIIARDFVGAAQKNYLTS